MATKGLIPSCRILINPAKKTGETKFINEKYLSVTRAPSFNNFASKLTSKISVCSVSFGYSNAYELTLTWIKYHNTAVRLHRLSGTALQKHIDALTIIFKNIFSLTSALISCKNELIVDSIKTSTKYALSSDHLLREAALEDEDEEEETVVDDEEVETDKGSSEEEEEQEILICIQQIVHDRLDRSLASKILDGKFVEVMHQAQDKSDSIQVLYEEAASTAQNSSATKDDVECLKLAVSQCINMLILASDSDLAQCCQKNN
ncbi:hypothetical protein RMATCC62417_18649 [Rhizopus microsporus]|nr:hypothetical protein RMATCC62417_18649 [Rhizopus microsporus]